MKKSVLVMLTVSCLANVSASPAFRAGLGITRRFTNPSQFVARPQSAASAQSTQRFFGNLLNARKQSATKAVPAFSRPSALEIARNASRNSGHNEGSNNSWSYQAFAIPGLATVWGSIWLESTQEMFREANTIGSKANDVEITAR